MSSYLLQIKPATETKLDFFYNELVALVDGFKIENEFTKLIAIPASNCVLLTTTNLQLRRALCKNTNYISTPFNTIP